MTQKTDKPMLEWRHIPAEGPFCAAWIAEGLGTVYSITRFTDDDEFVAMFNKCRTTHTTLEEAKAACEADLAERLEPYLKPYRGRIAQLEAAIEATMIAMPLLHDGKSIQPAIDALRSAMKGGE